MKQLTKSSTKNSKELELVEILNKTVYATAFKTTKGAFPPSCGEAKTQAHRLDAGCFARSCKTVQHAIIKK